LAAGLVITNAESLSILYFSAAQQRQLCCQKCSALQRLHAKINLLQHPISGKSL